MTDQINSFFVWGGAFMTWLNVYSIAKDKQCKGVSVIAQLFFMMWAVWSVYFYANQMLLWSLVASTVHSTGAIVWMIIFTKFWLTNKEN